MSNCIYGINGPVVTVRDTQDFSMLEMVYVGHEKLCGEVIGVTDKIKGYFTERYIIQKIKK